MKKLWWKIRLLALLTKDGYVVRKRWRVIENWKWVNDECWMQYFPDYTPRQALDEDYSNA